MATHQSPGLRSIPTSPGDVTAVMKTNSIPEIMIAANISDQPGISTAPFRVTAFLTPARPAPQVWS